MDELEQVLSELREEHMEIAGKIKCLQSLGTLCADLRYWLDDKTMSLALVQSIRETRVSVYREKINSKLSFDESTKLRAIIEAAHNELRNIVRERKYKSL